MHEGRYKSAEFDRVVFTIPVDTGGTIHNVVLQTPEGDILPLSVPFFCQQIIGSARIWYEKNKDNPQVRENLKRLPRLASDGLEPYVRGPTTLG
ncbi:hypothetical protein BH10PSE9_BH10PSE9_15470 [soil metagenome]